MFWVLSVSSETLLFSKPDEKKIHNRKIRVILLSFINQFKTRLCFYAGGEF